MSITTQRVTLSIEAADCQWITIVPKFPSSHVPGTSSSQVVKFRRTFPEFPSFPLRNRVIYYFSYEILCCCFHHVTITFIWFTIHTMGLHKLRLAHPSCSLNGNLFTWYTFNRSKSSIFYPRPIEEWLSLSHNEIDQSPPSFRCYLN